MNQPEPWETNAELEAFAAELSQALEPADPPPGFAGRVLARAASQRRPPAQVFLMPVRTRWAAGAVAAMLLAGVVTTAELHLRRQRVRAEQAQRQFQTAVAITSATLRDVREQLQGIDIPASR